MKLCFTRVDFQQLDMHPPTLLYHVTVYAPMQERFQGAYPHLRLRGFWKWWRCLHFSGPEVSVHSSFDEWHSYPRTHWPGHIV